MSRLIDNQEIGQVVAALKKAVQHLPDPSVTLVGKKFKNPFLVLISCLLSLRTNDRTTLPACERLFAKADTIEGMLNLSIAEIEKLIYPVGFYKTKAQRIKEICHALLNRFHGQVPDTMEDLLSLKGVGRKTANLVLVEGFAKKGVCVDTHVHRISNRLGYVQTKTPYETEMELRKKLPSQYWIEYNALLVLWGQNICRPISPLCSRCAVFHICQKRGVTTSR